MLVLRLQFKVDPTYITRIWISNKISNRKMANVLWKRSTIHNRIFTISHRSKQPTSNGFSKKGLCSHIWFFLRGRIQEEMELRPIPARRPRLYFPRADRRGGSLSRVGWPQRADSCRHARPLPFRNAFFTFARRSRGDPTHRHVHFHEGLIRPSRWGCLSAVWRNPRPCAARH